MDLITLAIGEIADLATTVGIQGAIAGIVGTGDELFEYVVGIAILIHEMNPA